MARERILRAIDGADGFTFTRATESTTAAHAAIAPRCQRRGGGEQGRSDLQSNIEAMRKIAEMAASVSAKAASAAGVSGWDQPPTGPPGPYAGAAQGGGGGMPFSGGGAEVTHTFDPRFEGKIIGRQGSVINELQTIHGVKLQVEKGRGILLMLGTPDAIARCKADIDAICVDDRAGGPVLAPAAAAAHVHGGR